MTLFWFHLHLARTFHKYARALAGALFPRENKAPAIIAAMREWFGLDLIETIYKIVLSALTGISNPLIFHVIFSKRYPLERRSDVLL